MKQLAPRLGDAIIALSLFALVIAGVLTLAGTDGALGKSPDGWAFVLAALVTLPVAWRQRAPRTVLWTAAVAWLAYVGIGYADGTLIFGLIVAIYSVALYLPRRQAIAHGGSVLAVMLLWTLVGVFVADGVSWASLAQLVIAMSVPFGIGLADSRRHERLTELEVAHSRREQAERIAAADAVRAERARIARELHDVVAHEVTVMTLQAEGARRRAADADPTVADALATISESGRKGLAEMQRMIGVLRTSEKEAADEAAELTGRPLFRESVGSSSHDDLAPVPSLAAIPALVRQVEDSGLPVALSITGTAHVPAGVELSAYRIIQESLTNALKYAGPGATARVHVRRKREAVTVLVDDDGRGVISDAAKSSGGHGIAGMAERVTQLGGTFDYGPRRGGGFRVHATLPVSDDQVGGLRPRSGAVLKRGV